MTDNGLPDASLLEFFREYPGGPPSLAKAVGRVKQSIYWLATPRATNGRTGRRIPTKLLESIVQAYRVAWNCPPDSNPVVLGEPLDYSLLRRLWLREAERAGVAVR